MTPEPEIIEPPAKPLSKIQYCVSANISDDKPHGFTSWLVLVPNGHFILEHCKAPDYSAKVNAEMDPFQSPTCIGVLDT